MLKKITKLAIASLILPFIMSIPTAYANDYFTSTDDKYAPSNINIINVMNRVMHSPDFMCLVEGQTEVIHGRQYNDVTEAGDSASVEGADNEKNVLTAKDANLMNIGKNMLGDATSNTNGIYNNNYENNPYWSRDLSKIAGLTDEKLNQFKNEMMLNWNGFDTYIHNYDDIRDTFAMQFALSQDQWNKFLNDIKKEWANMNKGIPMYGVGGTYGGNPVGGVDTSGLNGGAGDKATGVPVDTITIKNETKQTIDSPTDINYPLYIGYSMNSTHQRDPSNNYSGWFFVKPTKAESIMHSYKTRYNTIVDYDRWKEKRAYLYIKNNEAWKTGLVLSRADAEGQSPVNSKNVELKPVYEARNGLITTELTNINTNDITPVKVVENAKELYDKELEELNKQLQTATPEEQPIIQEQIIQLQNNKPANDAEVGDTSNAQAAVSNYPNTHRFNTEPTMDKAKMAADLFDKYGYHFDPKTALDLLNGAMGNFNVPIDFNGYRNALNDLKKNFSMLSNGLTPYNLNYINNRAGYDKYQDFINKFYFQNKYGLLNQNLNYGQYFGKNQPFINVSAIKEVNLKEIKENVTYYSNFNQDYLWRIYDSSGKEVGVYETGAPELYIMAGKPDLYTVEQFQRADVYLATVKSYRIRYYIFSPITNTLLAAWEDADERVFPQDGTHSTSWVKVWDGTYQTRKGKMKIKKNSDLWDTQQIR